MVVNTAVRVSTPSPTEQPQFSSGSPGDQQFTANRRGYWSFHPFPVTPHQHQQHHPRFLYTMYSPSFNPYSSGPAASLDGPPYPVYSSAPDMSQGYGTKYGPPSSGPSSYGPPSGHGGGSSYGPPPSSSGGYDYHPAPPQPAHHHHHSHTSIPVHFSSGKSKKGKGGALSALTLLAFLYFLNLLQSCLKEHMDTMNPTVMVMTAGATRRKDFGSVLLTGQDGTDAELAADEQDGVEEEYEMGGGYAANDDEKYHLLTSSKTNRTRGGQSFFGGGGTYYRRTKQNQRGREDQRKKDRNRQYYREEEAEEVYEEY
ncbi:hypothetical protein quinque_013189 [Culex quinquefasciatus]